jgi:hypothetical protein
MAQSRYQEAADFFEKRYAEAPHAENLYALAEALERAGRHNEADASFAIFEQKALAESMLADNANHELIAYYADFAKEPAKALRLAEQELTRRHDIYTIDAHAWSLAASGKYTEASAEIHRALAVGAKDPKLLDHARLIAQRTASDRLTRASR